MRAELWTMAAAAALALGTGTPALGQEYPIYQLDRDLDGDGRAERFELIVRDGAADLVIRIPGRRDLVARDIAWVGGIGQEPTLDLNPAGSVQVVSMNEGIGRNRWMLTLTIAHRNGDYRIAGVTWGERDTLDLDAWRSCDVNMLTGRAVVEDRRGKREVRGTPDPRPVTQWTMDEELPAQCG